jgi:two-component system, NarL family, sensor histidine kinase UhpB
MSLLWRVVLVNAVVLAGGAFLLAITPATISPRITAREAAILAGGLVAVVAVQVLLLRRTLGPLRQLTSLMRAVDPMRPGRRLSGVPAHDREVAELTVAFNAMLDRLESERQASVGRALAAQEEERLRIARELHDEVGQMLTAIAIEADRAGGSPSAEERAASARIAGLARESLDELGRIGRELRPEALDDLGLVNALIALCTRVADQSGIAVERRLAAPLPARGSEIDLVVYRVAQEGLTNVMRHSGASHVLVSLDAAGPNLVLVVRDDGCGIGTSPSAEANGIAGMRERARLVGGRFSLRDAEGGGTELVLEVPLGGAL